MDARAVFITLMLALPAVDLVILAVGALTLRGFVRSHPRISTAEHLADFKKLVKLQKYLALASLPILYAPAAVFLLGLFLNHVEIFWDVLYSIVPSLAIVGAAKLMAGLQHDAETLPVENNALKEERDRVVGVWHNRALPDW